MAIVPLDGVLASGSTAPALAPEKPASRGVSQGGAPFARIFETIQSAAPRVETAPTLGQSFEAVVLTPLVAEMLPDDDNPVWGGSAGRLWRGLFAEHLAAEIAESGDLGIAVLVDRMMADRTGDIG
ncbi:hypothetical protein [Acuticoccus kandeliae]|uniref:hypothetical protein n=1 Tax=Acuticoccus kandeliae TaxID=2073160 RepID=UPI00130056A2|nr:hypothetical protein [Acuticoccus kandeliae]